MRYNKDKDLSVHTTENGSKMNPTIKSQSAEPCLLF